MTIFYALFERGHLLRSTCGPSHFSLATHSLFFLLQPAKKYFMLHKKLFFVVKNLCCKKNYFKLQKKLFHVATAMLQKKLFYVAKKIIYRKIIDFINRSLWCSGEGGGLETEDHGFESCDKSMFFAFVRLF